LAELKCPICDKKQSQKPEKVWTYGKNIAVQRFKCLCGEFFNFYDNGNKTWTIPKKK